MPCIQTMVATESDSFKANRAAHLHLIDQFRLLESKVRAASAKAREKFAKRQQLLPRERVSLLLDRDTPFLELSTLAGLCHHEDDGIEQVYGGGSIAGIGIVSGVRVMIYASDAGIKGGAAHPLGIEKQLRAQDIAIENRLPFVQLVESAGANLTLQAEMFVRGGRTFANLARMSALGLPVLAVVHGSSTAGGAYQVGLSDYVVMVRKRSKVFLAGPPLLKAATGEIAVDEDLGGAELHTQITGTGDYMAETDADAIRITREIVAKLRWDRVMASENSCAPRYPVEELLGVVAPDHRIPYDVREVIARLTDNSDFLEFKASYGEHTVCGHAEIEGRAVGIVGNNGPIDSSGATKAAQFIQLCCQSGTSLLFLQNTTGFMVGVEAERSGIVKHGSKLIQAVTNASVPKITIQLGGSFGAGAYAMCGRSFGPRFIFSWPNNRIAVMGGEQAAKVMAIIAEGAARSKGREPDRAMIDRLSATLIEQYDQESRALFGTARLWDDGLIDPRDTRAVVALCLATAAEGDARILHGNSFGVARL
ncbi:acyl-CoA carboxylase subunit beta [Nitrobacter sp.]|uniref:acyl-CoA carboxylase subunit beta n=1 Tax=Nitrobacter sp. TaxID=29420 RepID=UPI0029CAB7D9|nr:carboxyl transferase domain-containing protein [Nitrobacter sp.]